VGTGYIAVSRHGNPYAKTHYVPQELVQVLAADSVLKVRPL
jgi:hypothetical protein